VAQAIYDAGKTTAILATSDELANPREGVTRQAPEIVSKNEKVAGEIANALWPWIGQPIAASMR
jgi:hypothetical protein